MFWTGNQAGAAPTDNAPSGDVPLAIHVLVAIADADLADQVASSLAAAVPAVIRHTGDPADTAAQLHDAAFDVVIADVEVEGFSDPLLLRLARDTQPGAVRIGMITRERDDPALASLAHQVLTPSDLDTLGERVRRSMARHRAVENPIVLAQIANCDVLPGVPELLVEISRVLADPESTMADLGDIVATDPELTARVLQLTNSAFYARRTPTADIAQAVAWLGTPAIRGLVVHLEVLRAFRNRVPQVVLDLAQDLQVHAKDVAVATRDLLPADPEAWTAGLLHDIGKLILAANDPAGWRSVEAIVAGGSSQSSAERSLFGCDHAAVGACLLATWGLPGELIDAVAGHHDPSVMGAELHVAGAVHLADALVHGVRRQVDEAWLDASGARSAFDEAWSAAHP